MREPAGPDNATTEESTESPRQLLASGPPGTHADPATVLIVAGVCSVVLGGLVAAVTGPLELGRGSWIAAYLVLVGGVAQCAMGQARAWHPEEARPHGWTWTQFSCWNVGNAAVIGGTVVGQPIVVDLGSALLVIAVAIALHAERRVTGPTARGASPLLLWAYRIVLLVLAVSIPVGMVLSHLRYG